MAEGEFFTVRIDSGSERHEASADLGRPYLQELLVVYVHGIFSDQRATWGCTPATPGGVPEHVRNYVGADVDVLNFYWPSKFYETGDILRAAAVLGALLSTAAYSAERYRSLIFVCHSAGGLVVRELLCNDALGNAETGGAISRYDKALASAAPGGLLGIQSVIFRTLTVIDLAVPHSGGRWWYTRVGLLFYLPIYCFFFSPLFMAVRICTQGKRDWGFCRISLQLQRNNCWVRELRNKYLRVHKECQTELLPFPSRLMIYGNRDQVVEERASSDAYRYIVLDTNHSDVKSLLNARPKSAVDDGTVNREAGGASGLSEVVNVLRYFTVSPAAHISQRTVERTIELDMLRRVQNLAGDEDEVARARSLPGTGQTQAAVARRAWNELGTGHLGHIVIVGPAGVGKSLVVRHLMRRLGLAYLAADPAKDPRPPVPIGYALQGVKLTGRELDDIYDKRDGVGERLLRTLLDRWCRWINAEVSTARTVSIEWIWDQMKSDRVTIVFDAIDEFLALHPRIAPRDIRRMVEFVAPKPGTRIIFALRSSLQMESQFQRTNLYPLVVNADALLVIDRLTREQARLLFRELLQRLEHDLDEKSPLWDLVLTPLVLYYLTRVIDRIGPDGLKTRTGILELALIGLLLSTIPEEQAPEVLVWADALTVVVWAAFLQVDPDVPKEALLAEVDRRRDAWLSFLAGRRESDGSAEFLACLECAIDRSNWPTFVRTMFYPTGHKRVRIMHQLWSDHLTARYVRLCFRFENFAELAPLACSRPMAGSSAELLVADGFQITDATIDAMTTAATTGHFVRGNFCAVVASGIVAISSSAIRKLFGEMPNMEPIAQLVVLNGIGARSIAQTGLDPSRADLRHELGAVYRDILQARRASVSDWRGDPVFASIAIAYLLTYGEALTPGMGTAVLTGSDTDIDRAVSMVADVSRKPPIASPPFESLQASFVTLVEDLKAPGRAINGDHYLFYLVCAKVRGVQIRRVDETLEQIFADDDYAARRNRDAGAAGPYLAGIFALMKRMWMEATGAARNTR